MVPAREGREEGSHHFPVVVVERRQPRDHLVDQRAQRPPVHALPVRLLLTRTPGTHLLLQDLGREVLRRPAERLHRVAMHIFLRQAEVGDANVAVGVEEQVLGLQISTRH